MERAHILFAKQPILDRDFKIVAYELLYRNPQTMGAQIEDNFAATMSLINAVMATTDQESEKRYFINVDERFLFDDAIEIVPKERFVLELLEDVPLTPKLLERVDALRAQGYTIALDDVAQEYDHNLLAHFDILKVDLRGYPNLDHFPAAPLRQRGITLLAEKVETRQEAQRTKELGFSLFQGYFFAKPTLQRERVIDPYRSAILHILAQLEGGEGIEGVVAAIKGEPPIALRLLQYVNSAFFSVRSRIDSIQRAIALLGMKRLRIWLYLQLYGAHGGEEGALFELVRSRAMLMERLAKALGADPEKAYLTGLVSLLDVVLEIAPQQVFKLIQVDPEIERAVLHGEGLYGKLLEVARSIEEGKPQLIEGISPEKLNALVLESLG
ncbi:MAG: EAL domain-containing protein [Epsilonproteobacteria bacterium]|nr:EAL domain-containing protein [Campylobacterota bacterium]